MGVELSLVLQQVGRQSRVLGVLALDPVQNGLGVCLGDGIVDLEEALVVKGHEIRLDRLLALGIVVHLLAVCSRLGLAPLHPVELLAGDASLGHTTRSAETAPGVAAEVRTADAAVTVCRRGDATTEVSAVLIPDSVEVGASAAYAVARGEDAGPGLAADPRIDVAAETLGAEAPRAIELLQSHGRHRHDGRGKGQYLGETHDSNEILEKRKLMALKKFDFEKMCLNFMLWSGPSVGIRGRLYIVFYT